MEKILNEQREQRIIEGMKIKHPILTKGKNSYEILKEYYYFERLIFDKLFWSFTLSFVFLALIANAKGSIFLTDKVSIPIWVVSIIILFLSIFMRYTYKKELIY